MDNKNKQLEEFISKNHLNLAWFATSAGLLRGYIGTRIEVDSNITIDIRECQFMSVESCPKCEGFVIKINEIYGWGLAQN
jgi:hypothetical protein